MQLFLYIEVWTLGAIFDDMVFSKKQLHYPISRSTSYEQHVDTPNKNSKFLSRAGWLADNLSD